MLSSMTTVTFRDWTLTVDREATRSACASVINGSAEDCKCDECENYIACKTIAFPDEIKSLLDRLGVDYRKEIDIWRMCKDEDGKHRYSGFFHFKGSFDGKDCFIKKTDGGGTMSMTAIDESFSIGFTVAEDFTYFKDKESLVQVEFEARVPWTIDKKLEPKW